MELGARSLKGQMSHAGAIGARWVAIIGPEGAALRNMESGEQTELASGEVLHAVLRSHHAL
jgi:histidyl-tRNA synthetase